MAALYKLRKHQLRSVAKFDKLSGYLDLSAPGTGKTAVTATIFAKRHSYKKKAMLVFAPKTLLRSAWYDDIKKFTPHLKAVICPAEKRAAAFAEKADVYITNHDAVNWVAKQGKDFFKRFIMLTIDEGSAFKHHTSQRSKAMNRIKKHFETRALLSATLNANTIADIWHPVNLVDDGKRLGHSFFAFRNTVCQPEQVGRQTHMVKWHDKEGAEDAVFAALEDISMRHELSGIPENIVYTLPYYMPDRQLITYREMEATQLASIVPLKDRAKAVAARLRGERIDYTTVTAINAAAVTTKLLQIASGAVYQNPDTYHLIDTGRYEFILELVEDRKHPLVFFLWKHQRDFLVQQAEKKNLRFCVLDGEATAKERNDMVAAYQNGLYDVMFAHPASAAHGLTLTRGTSIIWASPTYNAEWFEQGNRRQYRIGQAEKTEVITVIAPGTIELKVYAKMEAKQLRMGNLNDLFAEAQAA